VNPATRTLRQPVVGAINQAGAPVVGGVRRQAGHVVGDDDANRQHVGPGGAGTADDAGRRGKGRAQGSHLPLQLDVLAAQGGAPGQAQQHRHRRSAMSCSAWGWTARRLAGWLSVLYLAKR
jgi:hypothetical protein